MKCCPLAVRQAAPSTLGHDPLDSARPTTDTRAVMHCSCRARHIRSGVR